MFIKTLSLTNLRNHNETRISFGEGFNLLVGDNGEGKTTVLEAVSIACHTKSFHASQDKQLVTKGSDKGYSVRCDAVFDNQASYEIEVYYPSGRGSKKITDSAGKRLFPKDVIGTIPLITLSPDDKELTSGSPDARRTYLDRILSQVSKIYLRDILDYRKILKQRNKLLADYKSKVSEDYVPIAIWTEKLIEKAIGIVNKRSDLIKEMDPLFRSYYSHFAPQTEEVSLEYQPDYAESISIAVANTVADVEKMYWLNYERLKEAEKIRGTTLIGPQRDEVLIKVNGMLAKEAASQGQHKSMMIALKFTEFDYIRSNSQNNPIVLLDDIFSELDERRSHSVLNMLDGFGGQIFISSTDTNTFDQETLDQASIFDVKAGNVTRRNI